MCPPPQVCRGFYVRPVLEKHRMTRFEYVSIFNGIVVALAIENVAASFHKLFEASGRVRWHWMAPTNAMGTSIGALAVFWSAWVGRNVLPTNPTLLTFLPTA